MGNFLLFVYGTLKKGCGNNSLLSDAFCLGRARTREYYSLYVLFAGLPAVIKRPVSQIKGELYVIDGRTLARIDILEGHPSFYRREEIVVIDDNNKLRNAYIYFYAGTLLDIRYVEAGQKLIESGVFACK